MTILGETSFPPACLSLNKKKIELKDLVLRRSEDISKHFTEWNMTGLHIPCLVVQKRQPQSPGDEEIHSPQIHVLDKSPWSYKKCQLLIRVPGLEPLPSIPICSRRGSQAMPCLFQENHGHWSLARARWLQSCFKKAYLCDFAPELRNNRSNRFLAEGIYGKTSPSLFPWTWVQSSAWITRSLKISMQ